MNYLAGSNAAQAHNVRFKLSLGHHRQRLQADDPLEVQVIVAFGKNWRAQRAIVFLRSDVFGSGGKQFQVMV